MPLVKIIDIIKGVHYIWTEMRCFLLIPALVLFLSNIPFVHKMDMKEMMVAVKKDGCCRKPDTSKGSCDKAETKPACGESAEQSKPACKSTIPSNDGERECSKQDASTCVCICCFQFAAPDQLGTKLQFGYSNLKQVLTAYLEQNWKDPQLALPWQPPDLV